MAHYTLAKHSRPMTTAVIQVAEDGTATLHVGSELVEHAVRVARATVMRVLADYAVTIGTGVRVTTQMPDGTSTRHRLDPDGTLASLRRNQRVAAPTGGVPENTESPPTRRGIALAGITRRARSRIWLLAIQVLLAAAVLAVLATN